MAKGPARYLLNPETGQVLGWNRTLGKMENLVEISEEEAVAIESGEREPDPQVAIVPPPEATEVDKPETTVSDGSAVAVTDFVDGAEPPGEEEILAALVDDDA